MNEYIVQIEVKVTVPFLWSITKAVFRRKDLRIIHTFDDIPYVSDPPSFSALKELIELNRLKNDRDAYCLHLAKWGIGEEDERPSRAKYGVGWI